MNDLRHLFGNARGFRSLMMCLLLITLGQWTEMSTAATPAASRLSESDDVFQKLADLEMSSNRLIMTISEVGAAGFIRLLEQNPDFAGPLTSSETETLRQLFVRSLKFMLNDESTAKLAKAKLAQLYAASLTPTDAQALTAGYEIGGSGLAITHLCLALRLQVDSTGFRSERNENAVSTSHTQKWKTRPAGLNNWRI